MIGNILKEILGGNLIGKECALSLIKTDLDELTSAANELREKFCGNGFDLCTIINGKSGRCFEDCKYCAQSAHYHGDADEYPLLNTAELLEGALYNHEQGILRYSVVTSGRRLSSDELERLCESYRSIKKRCAISLCASHGLLDYEGFVKLKEAGVSRCHNNLETSRRFFPEVCTTHTYDEKIAAIQAAQRAGLSVCSGGIMGLGETMEDRIDMALELRRLEIKSVPINFLNPIPGTPFENRPLISVNEARRIVAVFRFILPDAAIRLAGGRGVMTDLGRSLLMSGANAAISGDMLTTPGISIEEDMKMVLKLGYRVMAL